MSTATKKPGLDFDSYIAERTNQFSGRVWAFERIHEWLKESGPNRFFLLTGEPGSGKTAIAARLVEFSRGVAAAPPSCPAFSSGFLSAVHFCVARATTWIDPTSFARSISLQLAVMHQQFATALQQAGDRSINVHFNVNQQFSQANNVTGVSLELTLNGVNPQAAFTAVVVNPLSEIHEQGFDLPVTILVDGLDEALAWKGDVTIITLLSALDTAPPNVRFILTSRRSVDVENEFLRATNFFLSSDKYDVENNGDMQAFLRTKLAGSALADASGAIADKAERNFQYATFFLNNLPGDDTGSMAALPAGLDSLYRESLSRVIGPHNWSRDYAPLMGLLSVARESMTDSQLKNFSGFREREIADRLADLRQFIEETGPPRGYRLYHQSIVDFLKLPDLRVPGNLLRNEYYLPSAEWHERVANYYFYNEAPSWARFDAYGLRYTSAHLAEAAYEESNGSRHTLVRRLVRLVIDPKYRTRHLAELDDVPALLRDLTEAVRCAALDSEGVLLLVQSALALVAFRDQELRPQSLFDLAADGQMERAARRLELFEVDEDWARVAQLTIAWLGVAANREAARALMAKVNPAPGPGSMLLEHVRAAIENTAPPSAQLPLEPPRPESEVAARVDWFGGKGSNPEMLQRMVSDSFIQHDEAGAAGYFAVQDAPALVAFAAARPPDGDRYLRQYIAIHSGYQYVQYRNRSLWIVLENVLRHPDPNWIREMVRELTATALAGSSLEFREVVPLTVLALQAAQGKDQCRETLQTLRSRAIEAAAAIPDEPGTSGLAVAWRPGGTGAAEPGDDPWGAHRRRLAAHAQILARLEGDCPRASGLLKAAANLKRGFAGFQAPVYMMLAETFLLCNSAPNPVIDTVLEMAIQAAHNVQDASFCLRITSRCNAMRRRWWGPFELHESVRLLVDNPRAVELTALHYIGERFEHRDSTSLTVPDEVRNASTLRVLSSIYHRPLSEIQRANPGLDASETLAGGTIVNIPDPGFATWIAARLSAEALAQQTLDDQERVALIQLLVPIAAPNPTVLDLVLARLLLALGPQDTAVLEALESAAGPAAIRPIDAFEARLPS